MTIITPHSATFPLRAACTRLRELANDRGQWLGLRVYSRCMRVSVLLVLAVGCGNVTVTPDGPPPIDMPPDLGPHRHYVMDRQTVDVTANSLDVDGDGNIDNQLGSALSALGSQGFDVKGATNSSVDHGALILLLDLQVPDLGSATAARFTTFEGQNPQPPACGGASDVVCRQHLAGTASFDISPSSPNEPPLAGINAGGEHVSVGPGKLRIQLAPLGTTLSIDLVAAHAELKDITDTTLGNSIIAGGITEADVDGKFIPAAAQSFEAIVVRDCVNSGGTPPDCGCVAGSSGSSLLNLFDTAPQDCRIVEDEVRSNSLIQSLLAPDLTLEGGVRALSFGFSFTAVRGEFTQPN